MRWGIEEDTYIPVFFQSTKGSLKHKVSLSFDLDHTSSIGNLILFGTKGLEGSTVLALALQNSMTNMYVHLKLNNPKIILVIRSPKLFHKETHFLSHFG